MKRDNLSKFIDDLSKYITSLEILYDRSEARSNNPSTDEFDDLALKKDSPLQRATSARRRLLKLLPRLEDSFVPPAGQSRSQFLDQLQSDIDGAWHPGSDNIHEYKYSHKYYVLTSADLQALDVGFNTLPPSLRKNIGNALDNLTKVFEQLKEAAQRAKGHGNDLPLSEKKKLILKWLHGASAKNSDNRQTAAKIAIGVNGAMVDENSFKQPLAALVQDSLLLSKRGRRGGYWLTKAGLARAKII